MKNIKDDLIVFGMGVIGFVITFIMLKFLYNVNQAFKIITFVVAMLSSLFVKILLIVIIGNGKIKVYKVI